MSNSEISSAQAFSQRSYPGMARTRALVTGLSSPALLRLLIRRTGLVLVSLAVLGWVSDRWTPISWLPPAALAVLALILLGRALRVNVAGPKNPVLAFSTGLIALAAGLAAVNWWLVPQAWLVLAAVSLGFVGLAGLGVRLRYLWRSTTVVPLLAASAAIILTAVGAIMAGRSGSHWPIIIYGLSILAGYLAIVFGTEPWLQHPAQLFRDRRLRFAGFGALAAGMLWLLVIGAGWYALAVVGVVGLLTLAITLDGDGEIYAVLLLFALTWAVFPRSVDGTPIGDQLAGDGPIVVAMGDSYMSGEGAERYLAGTNVRGENICRRAPTAWSQQFAGDEVETISLACSGALISHISGRPQYPGEPVGWPEQAAGPEGANQITQLAWLLDNAEADRLQSVVLTIGGNDAGFSRAGIACVGPGDCDELAPVWEPDFDPLEDRLVDVFAEIRATMDDNGAREVPLLVTGYPVPLTAEGCAWTWLSADEHAFIVRFVRLLNGSVSGAAERAGVGYIDTIPGSLEAQQLRFCEDQPWQGGLNFFEFNPMEGSLLVALDPRNWVNNSFHPNERGHDAMTVAVQQWLETDGDGDGPEQAPPPLANDGQDLARPCSDQADCGAYVEAWSRQQIALLFRLLSGPVILLFVGSWLLITPWQARFRQRQRRIRLVGPILDFAQRVL